MVAQQHKIMRQVLEVRGCPPGAAQRIQSELRGVYYQRLLPRIEKICSGLSAPGRVHRIDTLEIDLGEVPLHALESALADRFEAAFSRKLAAAIGGAPEIDSELELFSYFIRTGTVPWWADRSDRSVLEASLHGLIRRVPQALRRAIQAAPDQERARRRIARAYPDRLLDDVAGVMAPRLATACPGPSPSLGTGLGSAWSTMIESVSGMRGYPARAARNFWWEEVLRAAGAGGVSEAPGFFRAILTRVARRLGSDYRSLVADLRRTLDDSAVQPWAREITESLWSELGGDSMKTRGSASPGGSARVDLVREPPVGAQDAPVVSPFSDADEVYVENAGLAILWPFLESFFGRLGLTEEKRFKDEAAVHRAVGLLQYVAGADESPPEYLLPLNKVLCGMAPDEVLDFGPDITPEEIEECTDLLAAVIQQAPILREMSIPGFRGSFLLRKGQLGSRDGNWLLRVERETHDVVLDRFPWSVHLVKLPWMEAMMQVEW